MQTRREEAHKHRGISADLFLDLALSFVLLACVWTNRQHRCSCELDGSCVYGVVVALDVHLSRGHLAWIDRQS